MALAPALVLLHQNLDVGTNLTEIQIHVLNGRGKKRERERERKMGLHSVDNP